MPNENAVNLLPVNTILTDIGRQKRALAIISGTTVKIEKFVVGDSNGDTYIPIGDEIALRNEKYRTYIGSMGLDKNDKSTLQISSVIPEDVGGFEISEYGLIDADGDLIAIGTCDPINKPNPSEGKIYSLAMVLIMTVLNASAFEFLINYDGYVTYQYLFDEYIAQTHNIADGAITSEKLDSILTLPADTSIPTAKLGSDTEILANMKALQEALNALKNANITWNGDHVFNKSAQVPTASVGNDSLNAANTKFVMRALLNNGGGIVSSGNNASGYWCKFANGLTIALVTVVRTIGSASGNVALPITINSYWIGNTQPYYNGANGFVWRAAPVNNSTFNIREDQWVSSGVGNSASATFIIIGY